MFDLLISMAFTFFVYTRIHYSAHGLDLLLAAVFQNFMMELRLSPQAEFGML